jgi:hypothetical protein
MEKTRQFVPTSRSVIAVATLLLPFLLGACGKSTLSAQNGAFSDTSRAAMSDYENIRAALAADDLRAAQRASKKLSETLKPDATKDPATTLLPPAESITSAPALDKARQAFKKMSANAIRLTDGVSGYHVINCPMTPEGDWIQTDTTVSNPYMGKIMHDCGVVKK